MKDGPDYYKMSTEFVNGHLRDCVDAIRVQVLEAPESLKVTVRRLNDVAVEFTGELYGWLQGRP